MTVSAEPPHSATAVSRGAPVCPDCGQEVVATVCGADPNMSEESAEAIRWVIVARPLPAGPLWQRAAGLERSDRAR